MIPYFDQPTLNLGPAVIHGFGVLVAIAVLVGSKLTNYRAEKDGLSGETSSMLLGWIFVTGFLVAHLVDRLVYFPSDTMHDPWSLVRVWSGLSSFGGFLGGILGAALFLWRHPQSEPWRYIDS